MEDGGKGDIWEQMVMEERRQEALENGFLRLSDFEEEMHLINAMRETSPTSLQTTHTEESRVRSEASFKADNIQIKDFKEQQGEEEEEAEDGEEEFEEKVEAKSPSFLVSSSSPPPPPLILGGGSRWYQLSQELVDCIFSYIGTEDVDVVGTVYLLSKTPVFQPSSHTFRRLCKDIYFNQTGNIVSDNAYLRFNGWRNMLILRPRVRTNGFYSLRTVYSKAPSNDAFWEEKVHIFIEVFYFDMSTNYFACL